MTTLADNPLYKVCYEKNGIKLYMPIEVTNYHKSREVAMQAQEKYSNAGITKETLQAFANRAIEICNKEHKTDTLRSDMVILWSNLLSRTQSPVDELCIIRMGAIACFLENEPTDQVIDAFTRRKVKLAEEHPDLYAFFLNMGIAFTPAYMTLLGSLNVQDYLTEREISLNLMLPNHLKTKSSESTNE